MTQENAPPKRENIWLNLGLNVLLPSLMMSKGEGWYRGFQSRGGTALPVPESASDIAEAAIINWHIKSDAAVTAGDALCTIGSEAATVDITAPAEGFLVQLATIGDSVGVGDKLGAIVDGSVPAFNPAALLIVALAFPVCYGIYDFVTRRKYNFFSVLGFVSILISGGVGLLELDKDWIAIKEAAIPALFAIAVLVSLRTRFPLIRTFLYTPELFNVPKVEAALKEKQNESLFEKLMARCTLYLAGSFVLSAILNYALAKFFIRSETGSPEFVKEMGQMTLWSWPVITLPSVAVMMYALMQLVSGIEKYTGYEMEDVLLVGQPPKSDAKKSGAAADTEDSGDVATSDAEANTNDNVAVSDAEATSDVATKSDDARPES